MLLAVPALSPLLGVDVPGVPVRAPLAVPPAVGDCLIRSTADAQPVDCRRPHTAEVVKVWSPALFAPQETYRACRQAAIDYLGADPAAEIGPQARRGWSAPRVQSMVEMVEGPGTDINPSYSWQACLVAPISATAAGDGYSGRLRDISLYSPPALALRHCYLRQSQIVSDAGCSADHAGELLAIRSDDVPASTQDADPTGGPGLTSAQTISIEPVPPGEPAYAQCQDIARRVTGNADATYSGALELVVGRRPIGRTWTFNGNRQNGVPTTTEYLSTCALEATPGTVLFGSVVGLGINRPPVR